MLCRYSWPRRMRAVRCARPARARAGRCPRAPRATTRKAARNGPSACCASGAEVLAHVQDRRHRKLVAARFATPPGRERRQRQHQAGHQQFVERDTPGLGRAQQRGRLRRPEAQVGVRVVAVLDLGIARPVRAARGRDHPRQAEDRPQRPPPDGAGTGCDRSPGSARSAPPSSARSAPQARQAMAVSRRAIDSPLAM